MRKNVRCCNNRINTQKYKKHFKKEIHLMLLMKMKPKNDGALIIVVQERRRTLEHLRQW